MKRRANGEGSVFRLKDGSWRAACRGGKPSFRGDTRDEAIRRRAQYLNAHGQILALPRQARDSFAALISQWLDARRASLAPRTLQSYHDTATRYVIPAIGSIPAGRLTADDVRKAMLTGPSPRTQNYIRTICVMALEYGVDRDILARNVARKTDPVKAQKRERVMPSPDQLAALQAAIDAEAIVWRALLLVFALCGLRESEACGLRWPDYQDGQLFVQRQLGRDGLLVDVKTSAGRRVVPVSERASAALEAWRVEQARLRDRHSRRWRDAAVPDLMFTTRYGTPLGQRNVLRAVHRVTSKAGQRRSTHYLRHLAISRLLADGVDLKTVQAIAGHESTRFMLDVYGHVIPGGLEKARASMER